MFDTLFLLWYTVAGEIRKETNMKKLNKLIAVLLVVAALVSVFMIPAAAASPDDEEKIVARMYIGHKPRYGNLSGHTWVYIENLTNHDLTVGAYNLKKGKGVSVGTFGYSIMDGRGLYYNVEAYRYRNVELSTYIALSKELTQADLDKVSNTILYSGAWSYLLNCAFSAFNIWNSVPGEPLVYVVFPMLHQFQILFNLNHTEGFKMTSPTMDDIYKQIGVGSNATLVPADPRVPD